MAIANVHLADRNGTIERLLRVSRGEALDILTENHSGLHLKFFFLRGALVYGSNHSLASNRGSKK